MDANELVREYQELIGSYEACAKKIHLLCADILESNSIPVHSVSSRAKAPESLSKKLSRPDKWYGDLASVTDLAALRVITYLSDDHARVCEVIEREFEIDRARSIDKSQASEPDKFGYASVHYIAKLSSGRRALVEYHGVKDLYFEIQVRSILQHAWAEIEHDLGYKSDVEVPFAIRRRFSRLSGLLELADSEFNSISQELESYRNDIVSQISNIPRQVAINKDSLIAFVKESPACRALDSAIAHAFSASLVDEEDVGEVDINRLSFFGISTIGQLSEQMGEHDAAIRRFAARWAVRSKESASGTFFSGVSLFYLAYVLAASSADVEHVSQYLRHAGFNHDEDDRRLFALEVIGALAPS